MAKSKQIVTKQTSQEQDLQLESFLQRSVRKYIDPMVDFGFKKIFKESGKKQLIIRPLNVVFGLDLVDVDITESELLGLTEEERRASYDLHCKTRAGDEFIIEVQLAEQKYFMERAVYYTSLTIAHQGEHGEWNFGVHPVFFLGLMNFDMRHLDPSLANEKQFTHKFMLREDSTNELMTESLRFAFMEVARFNKPKDECKTFEERFLYIMKNLPTFVEKPELWDDDPYFDEMVQEAEFASMTLDEKIQYAYAMKAKRDYKNTIDFAREQGEEAGFAEGLEKGKVEVAKRMLADGLKPDLISKYTGLTEEHIAAL